MSFYICRAVPCAFLAILGSVFLCARSTAGDPAPFFDGRLVLHYPGEQEYSPGYNFFGNSGEPACDQVTAQVPTAASDVAIVYALATFPLGQTPGLGKLTFGVHYDPALLEIIDFDADAYVVEQSASWPAPGSSIHLTWDPKPRRRSVEVVWFAVRQLTQAPALLELQAGSFGGEFGDDHVDWPIEGFGTLGFGREGNVECPPHGTCCLPPSGCQLFAERWCLAEGGEFLGIDESCADCSAVGACCHGSTCRLTTETQCASAQWEYAGNGSVCEPNACIPFGACCAPDGSCSIVQQNRCEEVSFFPGMTCDPSPCAELGACCYWDHAICLVVSEEACTENGSEYQGDGSVCTPESCFPGVCCFGDDVETCMYSTPEACTSAGGSFLAGGWGPPHEVCWNVCCCGPTIEGSWGAVKGRFRQRN